MIRTSNYTNLTASITGRGKRGLFALGEVAQKKLYTAEHIPSSSGEWGLFFTLLSLAHAAAGIPPSLPGMPHSATIRVSRHCTTGTAQTDHRCGSWATSASGSLRSCSLQMGMKRIYNHPLCPEMRASLNGEQLNGLSKRCTRNRIYQGSACILPRGLS